MGYYPSLPFIFHLLNPSSIFYSRRYYPSHLSYQTFPPSYHLRRCLPPSQQQLVVYSIQPQQAEQEDVEEALGEEEKEKKHCAKFGCIPWLEYFLLAAAQPAARVLGTCQLTQK